MQVILILFAVAGIAFLALWSIVREFIEHTPYAAPDPQAAACNDAALENAERAPGGQSCS